jgi:hypothetical protein
MLLLPIQVAPRWPRCVRGLDWRSLMPSIPELEQSLRDRLDAFPLAARAELLHVLMLPDFDRAARIGEFWASPATRSFGELLIDLEDDRVARAVVVGMLRELPPPGG